MAKFLQRVMIRLLPLTPGFLMWPVARRYIAGSGLADAIRTSRELNERGATTTLDILGEELESIDEARDIARRYRDALDAIDAESLRANISIKLSAFGIRLDPDACRDLVVDVLTRAKEYGTFVRFDMEDSSLTQPTLDLFRELRPEFPNTGVVLQAMLKRTVEDARALAEEGARIRLVKGIYVEPADIAHRDFQVIRETFVEILGILLEGKSHVAIATHDGWLVQQSRRLIREHGIDDDRYEFQMLLGVREKLRDALIKDGLGLRVYVPFGKQWRAYSVRRMKENPQLLDHVLGSMLPWRRG